MAPPPDARRGKTDSLKRSADHLDDEAAHPRSTTRRLKGPPSKQNDSRPPIPQADISTEAPVSKADSSTGPESGSYLFEYIKKQIFQKREKPVRDGYHEVLKAVGQGRKDAQLANAGATDRDFLEETAKLKLQAGLEAVRPAIEKEVQPFAHLLISEYSKKLNGLETRLATIERDNRERPKGPGQRQHALRTRAEAARTREMSPPNRNSLGLALDRDTDNPDSGATAGEQKQGNNVNAWRTYWLETDVISDSDSTAKEDPSTDPSAGTPAEE